jgi:hypothetical protein
MTKGITQVANAFMAGMNRVALAFMPATQGTTRQGTSSAVPNTLGDSGL